MYQRLSRSPESNYAQYDQLWPGQACYPKMVRAPILNLIFFFFIKLDITRFVSTRETRWCKFVAVEPIFRKLLKKWQIFYGVIWPWKCWPKATTFSSERDLMRVYTHPKSRASSFSGKLDAGGRTCPLPLTGRVIFRPSPVRVLACDWLLRVFPPITHRLMVGRHGGGAIYPASSETLFWWPANQSLMIP